MRILFRSTIFIDSTLLSGVILVIAVVFSTDIKTELPAYSTDYRSMLAENDVFVKSPASIHSVDCLNSKRFRRARAYLSINARFLRYVVAN